MRHKASIADSVSASSFEGVPASTRASGLSKRAILGGIDSLGDAELVAAVLGNVGSGAPHVSPAAALIDELGVAGLACAGMGEISQRRGIGIAKAVRLAAAIELGRRAMLAAALEGTPCLRDRDAVVAWARPRLATLDHEELWVLLLDGRNGLRAARRVAVGGIHGLHVSVRDVLRIALREAASAFILVHNHPSGDPTPSREDETFTRAVTEGARLVGCPLLDHVIVARQRASSMLDVISAS
jgi:DNA repair protein RadC